jgi:hypothetical protein
VKPPDDDTIDPAAEPGSPQGSVQVGGYVLRVGGAAGTILERGAQSAGGTESLAWALQAPASGEERKGAVEQVAGTVEEASAVTAKVERALTLGKGMAEGRALDPEQLSLEVDSLLGLLERLDREGRWEEALRLARAVSTVVSLLKRWAALLRTLRAALRASEKLGDLDGLAWAKHELGTLQVTVGDVGGAERNLHEALEIRDRLGDRRGLAATSRNMQVLCEQLRQMLRERKLVQRRGRWSPVLLSPLLLAIFAAVALAVGGVTGGVLAKGGEGGGGGGKDGPTTKTDDPPPQLLSVTVTGSGTISSEPPGISCGVGATAASRPKPPETRFAATGSTEVTPEGEVSELGAETSEGETGAGDTVEPRTEDELTEPEVEEPGTEEPGGKEEGGEDGDEEGSAGEGSETSCSHAFDPGETVVLTAESESSSVEFSESCTPLGETQCSVTLDQAQEVTVTFETID